MTLKLWGILGVVCGLSFAERSSVTWATDLDQVGGYQSGDSDSGRHLVSWNFPTAQAAAMLKLFQGTQGLSSYYESISVEEPHCSMTARVSDNESELSEVELACRSSKQDDAPTGFSMRYEQSHVVHYHRFGHQLTRVTGGMADLLFSRIQRSMPSQRGSAFVTPVVSCQVEEVLNGPWRGIFSSTCHEIYYLSGVHRSLSQGIETKTTNDDSKPDYSEPAALYCERHSEPLLSQSLKGDSPFLQAPMNPSHQTRKALVQAIQKEFSTHQRRVTRPIRCYFSHFDYVSLASGPS